MLLRNVRSFDAVGALSRPLLFVPRMPVSANEHRDLNRPTYQVIVTDVNKNNVNS